MKKLKQKKTQFIFASVLIFLFFTLPATAFFEEKLVNFPRELASNETIVHNYSELRDALQNNNGIDTVYLGSDITMGGGIDINSGKTTLKIVGFDPTKSEKIIHTLTDYQSLSQLETIRITPASNLTNITISDIKIIGKNYYGSISAVDSVNLSGLEITFSNVIYDGPQLVYHRQGLVKISGITAKIHGQNGGSPRQEFAEAARLVVEGENFIVSESSAYSVFWFPTDTGSLTVETGGKLEVIAENLSTYGVFALVGSDNKFSVKLDTGAVFRVKTNSNLFGRSLTEGIENLTINRGAMLEITSTDSVISNTLYPLLRLRGDLILEENAKFYLKSERTTTSSGYFLECQGNVFVGTGAVFHVKSDSQYAALLRLFSGKIMTFSSPASVVFYSPSGRILQSNSGTGTLNVECKQLNYYKNAASSGFENRPLYSWENEASTLQLSLNFSNNGTVSDVYENYEGEQPSPSKDNLSFSEARVLAFGELLVTVQQIDERDELIYGETYPFSALRISSELDGKKTVYGDLFADTGGVYQLKLPKFLVRDTVVTVTAVSNYLFAEAVMIVLPYDFYFMEIEWELEYTIAAEKEVVLLWSTEQLKWNFLDHDASNFLKLVPEKANSNKITIRNYSFEQVDVYLNFVKKPDTGSDYSHEIEGIFYYDSNYTNTVLNGKIVLNKGAGKFPDEIGEDDEVPNCSVWLALDGVLGYLSSSPMSLGKVDISFVSKQQN